MTPVGSRALAGGMASWSTDLSHLPPRRAEGVKGPALERAEFTREVVEAATSRRSAEPWTSAVMCVARAGRKRCRGHVSVQHLVKKQVVEWSCTACEDTGTVTGFAGGESDLRRFIPRGKEVNWGVDAEQRAVLLEATEELPALRAVISRARIVDDIPGLLWIRATVEELDELYTLVEELTDWTRSRKRRELLDDLRATLCTSIDGF